jgi:hypothetical protein
MNPALSVVGDLNGRWTDDPGADRSADFGLSEVEIGFQAALDPYLRLDVFTAFGEHEEASPLYVLPDADADDEVDEHSGHGLEAALEEAYVTTLGLPAGLQLRAGRMRQPFGHQNLVHPPEDPWADTPTAMETFLGPEGLSDEAVELSWLVPTPFYWQLTAAGGRGPDESPTFARSEKDDFTLLLRNEMSWDLTDHGTLRVGQSWMKGPGEESGHVDSQLFGLDFTWRWIPSRRRSVTWQTEATWREVALRDAAHAHQETADAGADDEHDDDLTLVELLGRSTVHDAGAWTWVDVQFAQRWHAGLRVDWLDYADAYFDAVDPSVADRWDASLVLAWWPSEFQTLKVQVKRTWDDLLTEPVDSVYFNWTWVMGAHAAHAF